MYLLQALSLLPALTLAIQKVDWTKYKDPQGNALPDFSFTGYHSSNSPLPPLTTKPSKSLSPAKQDQTTQIQDALNEVGKAGGGVVYLAAGSYVVSKTLAVPNGTVLRGAGVSKTTLLPKTGSIDTVSLGTTSKLKAKTGASVAITDAYVPVGSSVVHVKSVEKFKVGDFVEVQREVTEAWIKANGNGGLGSSPGTWLTTKDIVYQPRTIASISSGNKVTFSVPLTDQLDAKVGKPNLVLITPPSQAPSEMGIEELTFHLSPSCAGTKVGTETCNAAAVNFYPWTTNSWARRLNIIGYGNGVSVSINASQLTIASVFAHRDKASNNAGGYWADIGISGSQVLVIDSGTLTSVAGAKSFSIVTQGLTPGPNAVVRHITQEKTSSIQPHAHWAHGLLIDNSTGYATLVNRADSGSGHGWAINSGVEWNNNGDYAIQSPPLGTCWGFGNHDGKKQTGYQHTPSNGSFHFEGEEIQPPSLFDAQLSARSKK